MCGRKAGRKAPEECCQIDDCVVTSYLPGTFPSIELPLDVRFYPYAGHISAHKLVDTHSQNNLDIRAQRDGINKYRFLSLRICEMFAHARGFHVLPNRRCTFHLISSSYLNSSRLRVTISITPRRLPEIRIPIPPLNPPSLFMHR